MVHPTSLRKREEEEARAIGDQDLDAPSPEEAGIWSWLRVRRIEAESLSAGALPLTAETEEAPDLDSLILSSGSRHIRAAQPSRALAFPYGAEAGTECLKPGRRGAAAGGLA